VAERQPLTRPRRRPKRRRPPQPTVAAGAVPAAEIAGAERETPTPLESNRPPRYPAAAIARGVEGTTVLRVTVGDDGSVVRLEVQDSSGSTVLDQAAMSAVALWRFRPQPAGVKGGTQSVRIPVRFRLDR
jgi:protein TonB